MHKTTAYRQALLFRALMHPARLAILELLRDGEACVCHVEAQLGYRQAYISQQLAGSARVTSRPGAYAPIAPCRGLGPGYENDVQNLHMFIRQLRWKREHQPAKPRYILTEPGIGYRFCAIDKTV